MAEEDDEVEMYRKRMMLAYKYRPNPLVWFLCLVSLSFHSPFPRRIILGDHTKDKTKKKVETIFLCRCCTKRDVLACIFGTKRNALAFVFGLFVVAKYKLCRSVLILLGLHTRRWLNLLRFFAHIAPIGAQLGSSRLNLTK